MQSAEAPLFTSTNAYRRDIGREDDRLVYRVGKQWKQDEPPLLVPSPSTPKVGVLQMPADFGLRTNFVLWVDEPEDPPPPQRLMPVSTKRHARALAEEAKPAPRLEEQPRQTGGRAEDPAPASPTPGAPPR